MADPNRNIKVTLTADVDNYIASMDRAFEATKRVHRVAMQERLWTAYVVVQSGLCGALVATGIYAIVGMHF